VTSFLDTGINFSVAISEEPEDFDLRMKREQLKRANGNAALSDRFEMHQWKKISQKKYKSLKKYNPSNESYLYMKREDYGHFVEEEKEDDYV
jgi:hypothetical protein